MAETIVDLFNAAKKEGVGAIITFNSVIKGKKFTKKQVSLAFHKLIPKDEFAKNEKRAILEDCYTKIA